ncbi:Sushi, nidogen and EGF-like domain-containing protein 1 [Exaiptasia diaphana]|nr:Sushi, nidogen and EGF-like domain-containing protein 1 [Exaiptasia diaphana]
MHELIPFGAVNGDILVPPGDDSVNSRNFVISKPFRFFGQDFTLLYLIPFGADNGDIMVPQGDDSANSGRVPIATSFRFFGQSFTSLYYVPKRFPLDDIGMVAPFWTDVDTREGGAIWYRQNATKKLLEEASTDIRKAFPEFPRFSAIWMFVATWEKVPFYGNKNKCGFNAGFRNYSYNVTDNGYRNISVLDLPFKTNVNKPGVWMFRTDIKVDESRNLLIPFGADNGDIMVPQGDDSTNSGKVDISTAFRFFGRKFTSLYVNINGVITFKNSFSNYVPKRFPFDDTVMIAPFWTDVDTRKGGAVWYRQNTSKNALKVASTDVRKAFPEFPRFLAIWMFVATWEKVTFYGTTNENITNTFQSVLLTDGRYSFVRFNYHNITWTSATTNGGNAKNGLGGNEAGVYIAY